MKITFVGLLVIAAVAVFLIAAVRKQPPDSEEAPNEAT